MVTVERFSSYVFAFVYFQITSLSARIVALVTLERLFSSVLEPIASDEKHEHRNSHTAHIRRVSRVCTFRVPARAQV